MRFQIYFRPEVGQVRGPEIEATYYDTLTTHFVFYNVVDDKPEKVKSFRRDEVDKILGL
jgi:hypothetical protein